MALLEVCVDNVAGVHAAVAGGADRIELCAALSEGGLTPSAGFVQWACQTAPIPVMVMIRPRVGDFCYSEAELGVMMHDIVAAKAAGAAGVVFGCLREDRRIDGPATKRLLEAAAPLSVTFHRAFDLTPDPFTALDSLIRLGIPRLLTSGQAATAPAGQDLIRQLVTRSNDRIVILPGSGIQPDNIHALLQHTGAREYHASASAAVSVSATLEASFHATRNLRMTSEAQVRALRAAVESAGRRGL